MRTFEQYLGRFPGAVSLPLVVEGVIAIVPIYRPVVDPLAPVRDSMPHVFGHVIWGQEEVL